MAAVGLTVLAVAADARRQIVLAWAVSALAMAVMAVGIAS